HAPPVADTPATDGLMPAVHAGDAEAVRRVIRDGFWQNAPVAVDGKHLMAAIVLGNRDVAGVLLAHGARLDEAQKSHLLGRIDNAAPEESRNLARMLPMLKRAGLDFLGLPHVQNPSLDIDMLAAHRAERAQL